MLGMYNCPKGSKGFTLIELLITIAVISVLASTMMILINPAKILANARNSGRASDLRQLANALDRYYAKFGAYPSTSSVWCGEAASYWASGCAGADWIPGLTTSGEIKALPSEPRRGESYAPCNNGVYVSYVYYSNGIDYKLVDWCGPENISATDKLLDPTRPTYAWAVWSSVTSKGW